MKVDHGLTFPLIKIEIPVSPFAPTRAILHGPATADDLQTLREPGPSVELTLSIHHGWSGNLGEATAFGEVAERLSVWGNAATDANQLQQWPRLRDLVVNGHGVHGILELDWLTHLQSFASSAKRGGRKGLQLQWGAGLALQEIRGLWSDFPPLPYLNALPNLTRLSVLKVNSNPEELAQMPHLRSLEVAYWPQLAALSQLGELLPRLQRLSLTKTSALVDYSVLPALQK